MCVSVCARAPVAAGQGSVDVLTHTHTRWLHVSSRTRCLLHVHNQRRPQQKKEDAAAEARLTPEAFHQDLSLLSPPPHSRKQAVASPTRLLCRTAFTFSFICAALYVLLSVFRLWWPDQPSSIRRTRLRHHEMAIFFFFFRKIQNIVMSQNASWWLANSLFWQDNSNNLKKF